MPATAPASKLGAVRATASAAGAWSRRVSVAKPAAPAPRPAELEPFAIDDRPDGLHLIRRRDGADMGIMASPSVAATQAAALARMGLA